MRMDHPQPLFVFLKGCLPQISVLKDHPLQSFQLPHHFLYALHFCPSGIYDDNTASSLAEVQEEYILQMKKSKLIILALDEIWYKHIIYANNMFNDAIENLSCTNTKI